MSIRAWFGNLVSSGMKVITDSEVKVITGPVKDLSGTAKDVTGIRRDLVETKLAEKKLEEQNNLIHRATLDDIKVYDPKFGRLHRIEKLPIGITIVSLLIAASLFWRPAVVQQIISRVERSVKQVLVWK